MEESPALSEIKYARQVLAANVISRGFSKVEQGEVGVNITFSENDVIRTSPHDNDPMVITI